MQNVNQSEYRFISIYDQGKNRPDLNWRKERNRRIKAIIITPPKGWIYT